MIAIAHAAATWFMAGVIWFVQLVHYPLMCEARSGDYPRFQREHERRTGWVVVPAMFAELGCAIVLVMGATTQDENALAVMGAVLLALIWISTFAVQVPLHRRLGRGFDPLAHRRLVATNWVRTIAWSARAILAALLL